MAIVSLPNGNCIDIPISIYLDMEDLDYQYLMSINAGDHINDPFASSSLTSVRSQIPAEIKKQLPSFEDIDEIPADDFSQESPSEDDQFEELNTGDCE
jgi:hypothetical protein